MSWIGIKLCCENLNGGVEEFIKLWESEMIKSPEAVETVAKVWRIGLSKSQDLDVTPFLVNTGELTSVQAVLFIFKNHPLNFRTKIL